MAKRPNYGFEKRKREAKKKKKKKDKLEARRQRTTDPDDDTQSNGVESVPVEAHPLHPPPPSHAAELDVTSPKEGES